MKTIITQELEMLSLRIDKQYPLGNRSVIVDYRLKYPFRIKLFPKEGLDPKVWKEFEEILKKEYVADVTGYRTFPEGTIFHIESGTFSDKSRDIILTMSNGGKILVFEKRDEYLISIE